METNFLSRFSLQIIKIINNNVLRGGLQSHEGDFQGGPLEKTNNPIHAN